MKRVRETFVEFFKQFGHGLLRQVRVGGRVSITFNPVEFWSAEANDGIPPELKEILAMRFDVHEAEYDRVRMFYKDRLAEAVKERGNRVETDFIGGDYYYKSQEYIHLWKNTIRNKPEMLIRDNAEDCEFWPHHEIVEFVPNAEKKDFLMENLKDAYEDLFGENRQDVADADEKRETQGFFNKFKSAIFGR